MRQNETALDSGSLAKFKDILRFASQYWGGVGALLIAMLLILVLILVVTNDALYNWVREYVIRTDAALSAGAWASFAKRIFAVLAVLAAGVVMYQGLLRYTKIGAERIHAWVCRFGAVIGDHQCENRCGADRVVGRVLGGCENKKRRGIHSRLGLVCQAGFRRDFWSACTAFFQPVIANSLAHMAHRAIQ